jgi:hypothetical protein
VVSENRSSISTSLFRTASQPSVFESTAVATFQTELRAVWRFFGSDDVCAQRDAGDEREGTVAAHCSA